MAMPFSDDIFSIIENGGTLPSCQGSGNGAVGKMLKNTSKLWIIKFV
jgi:hypothetical protein